MTTSAAEQERALEATAPERPRVSVVVPARNEERHIAACVRSILDQQLEESVEVIVADGRSADRTAELAAAAGAVVVANPACTTPAGLNAALARARGDVVVRFDAHAEMPPGYLAACLAALSGRCGPPVCVGGWRRVAAHGPWGRATAAALASRFGVGNPRLWRPPGPGVEPVDVDTVALGAWYSEHLRALGGWNERYLRNQDFELNYRLRRAGGHVVFDPRVWSVYQPRESLAAIARQYWDYGRFKALMLSEEPRSLRPRQLAPVVLLGVVAAAALPRRLSTPARRAVGLYGLALAGVAARSGAGWRTAAALATIHLTWGAGVLVGIAQHAARRR